MHDIIEFIQNNWAFLLVFSVIVLLVWSVMKISKRNDDGKFEQDDDEQNIKSKETIVRYNGWGIPENHEN